MRIEFPAKREQRPIAVNTSLTGSFLEEQAETLET